MWRHYNEPYLNFMLFTQFYMQQHQYTIGAISI